MPTKSIPKNTSANNVELLNATTHEMGLRNVLGTATLENYAQIGQTIMESEYLRNNMIPTLLNQLGKIKIKSLVWTNPLASLKKGLMEYGQTVEQIHINLCNEFLYNPDQAEEKLYQRVMPDVHTIFHQLNRKGFYKQTIEQDNLRQAFQSFTGVDELVTGITSTMSTSNEVDEYNYMKNLISNYIQNNYMYDVQSTAVTDKDTAQDLLVQLRAMARKLGFASRQYNQYGVDNITKIENLFLFITPEIEAQIDVRAFAAAFNLEFTNFIGHVIVVDDFGAFDDGDTQCVMCGEDFLQVFDTELSMATTYNEQGKYWNYFLHIWQVLSVSRFANCVRFTKGSVTPLLQPKVTGLTILNNPISVSRGGSVRVEHEINVENGANEFVRFSLRGTTSARSTIDDNGFLVIGQDETGANLRVKCWSVHDPSVSTSMAVTLIP